MLNFGAASASSLEERILTTWPWQDATAMVLCSQSAQLPSLPTGGTGNLQLSFSGLAGVTKYVGPIAYRG